MTGVLVQRGGDPERHTAEGGHGQKSKQMLETEMGVKLPPAKGLLTPPEADEAERSLTSQSLQRDDGPADTLILNIWLPEL